jgi:hypothetical protein
MEVGSLERLFRTPIAWAVGRRPSAVGRLPSARASTSRAAPRAIGS